MNLLKVISNDEPIGGLEISGNSLRFCLLSKGRTDLKTELLVEEKLLEKESLENEAAFTTKLSKFVKKNKIKYDILLFIDNVSQKYLLKPTISPGQCRTKK